MSALLLCWRYLICGIFNSLKNFWCVCWLKWGCSNFLLERGCLLLNWIVLWWLSKSRSQLGSICLFPTSLCVHLALRRQTSPPPWFTLSIVLSIWWKPMWLLPIRVSVSIVWIVTKWTWKTMSNNIFFLSVHIWLLVSVCVCVCLVFLCCFYFLTKPRGKKKIPLFLKTLCKYCWWKIYICCMPSFHLSLEMMKKTMIFMNNSGDVDDAEADYTCPSWIRAFDVRCIFVGGVVRSGQDKRKGVIPNTSQIHCSDTTAFPTSPGNWQIVAWVFYAVNIVVLSLQSSETASGYSLWEDCAHPYGVTLPRLFGITSHLVCL